MALCMSWSTATLPYWIWKHFHCSCGWAKERTLCSMWFLCPGPRLGRNTRQSSVTEMSSWSEGGRPLREQCCRQLAMLNPLVCNTRYRSCSTPLCAQGFYLPKEVINTIKCCKDGCRGIWKYPGTLAKSGEISRVSATASFRFWLGWVGHASVMGTKSVSTYLTSNFFTSA